MQNKHNNFEQIWFYLRIKNYWDEYNTKKLLKEYLIRKDPRFQIVVCLPLNGFAFELSVSGFVKPWRVWVNETISRWRSMTVQWRSLQWYRPITTDFGTKLYLFIRRRVSDNPVHHNIYCYFYTFSIFQHYRIYSTCTESSYRVPSIGLFHRQNWSFSPKTCQNFGKIETKSTDHEAESGPATSLKPARAFVRGAE